MTDKYELTDNTTEVLGHTLHQIKALKDFGDVSKGDLGGWVENYSNLSQTGTAWVYDYAMVYNHAHVYDDAKVYDSVQICDNTMISENAKVYGDACVYDNAQVYGYARVYNRVNVHGDARVFGYAKVYDDVIVYDNAKVYDNAQVSGDALVGGNARVSGNAKVYGYSIIAGSINIRENDVINNNKSYLIFNNTWSSGRQFVYVLSNHRWHVGCFDGTGEELIKKAYQDSELSGKMYELYVHFAEQVVETRQRNKGLGNVQ